MPFAVGSTTVSIDRSCIYTVQILCADIVYEYCVWILCEYIAILRANILYVKVDRWPDVLMPLALGNTTTFIVDIHYWV